MFNNSARNSKEALITSVLGNTYLSEHEDAIKKHICQVIWFSYREKFPALVKDHFSNRYTCDSGWGCMLRCGQMMLGEGIKRHLSKWKGPDDRISDQTFLEVISLFADSVCDPEISPFSIQQVSNKAYEYFELKPGEWYKPSNIMVTLGKLNEQHRHKTLQKFRTCIFLDGTVFEDQILEKAFNSVTKEEAKVDDKTETENKNQEKLPENSNLSNKEEERKNDYAENEKEKEKETNQNQVKS